LCGIVVTTDPFQPIVRFYWESNIIKDEMKDDSAFKLRMIVLSNEG